MDSIHPFLRRADIPCKLNTNEFADSSLLTKGRPGANFFKLLDGRFIPSYEGQTPESDTYKPQLLIHPFLRRADGSTINDRKRSPDSSLLTKGKRCSFFYDVQNPRFIPSYEGQTLSVYAAFSRLKHLVVQFTQMPFLAHPHI